MNKHAMMRYKEDKDSDDSGYSEEDSHYSEDSESFCSSIEDMEPPITVSFKKLYPGPESDAAFLRMKFNNESPTNCTISSFTLNDKPELHERFHCRQAFLRSYPLGKKTLDVMPVKLTTKTKSLLTKMQTLNSKRGIKDTIPVLFLRRASTF